LFILIFAGKPEYYLLFELLILNALLLYVIFRQERNNKDLLEFTERIKQEKFNRSIISQ
jgi:hypothetical protein